MQEPFRRAWVEVDLGALNRNAAVMRARAGAPLLPMVKADAYGLGADRVVTALEVARSVGLRRCDRAGRRSAAASRRGAQHSRLHPASGR